MLIKIIDGCVELYNTVYKVGDIAECTEERAKYLIKEGFCQELTDKYEIMRYKDSLTYTDDTKFKTKKNDKKVSKNEQEINENMEVSLDGFRKNLNL